MLQKLSSLFRSHGIEEWGICRFADLPPLFSVRAQNRLPQHPQSVLVALFPYPHIEVPGRNLSKYAAGEDYHPAVLRYLSACCEQLRTLFPENAFLPFCDISPLDEVQAAYLAGLGVVGDNGLLLNRRLGSYFFIGEIVTDRLFSPSSPQTNGCLHCGRCQRACPSGALNHSGFCSERCVSYLSQKKGDLSVEEENLLRQVHTVWGCDICQDVCPYNQNLPTPSFLICQEEPCFILTDENLDTLYETRAFSYRKKDVLRRNLRVIANDRGQDN